MTVKRPILWAGIAGAPLLVATVFAYHLWCHVLIARAHGYVFNYGQLHQPFIRACSCLALALAVGLIVYKLTHRQLPRVLRCLLVALVMLGITLFAVHGIVVTFGPRPYWHHP